MSLHLTKLQKRLCNRLQESLVICPRPFEEIAMSLNGSEEEILQQIGELKSAGILRQIRAIINYRSLGMASTLVAAHIEQGNLPEVVEAINQLEGVSHSYLRQHHYNLWFTLQTASIEEIAMILSGLSGRFGIEFHNLPVERIFKLDVRFDAEDRQQVLLQDVEELSKSEKVQLNTEERLILSKLQDELEITAKPFDFLCGDGLDEKEVLGILLGLIDKCIIRRIAGIVDHRKLGFVANVLFAGKVGPEHIVEAGKALARFGMVSHCYQRKATAEWPYTLYAMMHGRSMGDIQHVINKFVESEKVDSYELLPTEAELKKQSVKYQF